MKGFLNPVLQRSRWSWHAMDNFVIGMMVTLFAVAIVGIANSIIMGETITPVEVAVLWAVFMILWLGGFDRE